MHTEEYEIACTHLHLVNQDTFMVHSLVHGILIPLHKSLLMCGDVAMHVCNFLHKDGVQQIRLEQITAEQQIFVAAYKFMHVQQVC